MIRLEVAGPVAVATLTRPPVNATRPGSSAETQGRVRAFLEKRP